jgi:hypothetical protein
MCFVEAPRATTRKRLAKSPEVIKVPRIVKDLSSRRMKAKGLEICSILTIILELRWDVFAQCDVQHALIA